jgi:hypothetical protein
MDGIDTNALRARIMKQYLQGKEERTLSAVMKMDQRELTRNAAAMAEISLDEVRSVLLRDRTDEEYDSLVKLLDILMTLPADKYNLAMQIMDLITDHPDRRELAQSWTGKIEDLPAALARI